MNISKEMEKDLESCVIENTFSTIEVLKKTAITNCKDCPIGRAIESLNLSAEETEGAIKVLALYGAMNGVPNRKNVVLLMHLEEYRRDLFDGAEILNTEVIS